jgi:hypothetical protein
MAKAADSDNSKARPDGRRPLMLYMRPNLVVRLKNAAWSKNRHAYEIVEEAVEMWLASKRKK